MDILTEFISQYGTVILYTLITAIAGFCGAAVKRLYTKYVNDKTKKAVAKTIVMAVQQLYHDLSGPERLDIALASMSEMLAQKGISISELEMRLLIEAAVGEFKNVFNRTEGEKKEADPGNGEEKEYATA